MGSNNTYTGKYSIFGMGGQSVWKPDHSLPYQIHCQGHPLDGLVIIWPEIIEMRPEKKHLQEMLFCFTTNRDHALGGRIIEGLFRKHRINDTEVLFEEAEDEYGGPAKLRISLMTEEEFETLREKYISAGKRFVDNMEELVQIYIEDLCH